MRIRSIKPDFWDSPDTAKMDYFTRLLYIGLWNYADDHGIGLDMPPRIRSKLFPNDEGDKDLSRRIHGALTELSNGGQITRYLGSDGRPYLYIRSWKKHQRVNRPTEPKLPFPTSEDLAFNEGSSNAHGALTEDSLPEQGAGSREQGTGSEGEPRKRGGAQKRAHRLPDDWQPDADLVAEARSKFPGVNLESETEKFCDHFQSIGGERARKVDWRKAWRNWIRKANEFAPRNSGTGSRPNTHEAWSTPAGEPLASELPTFDDVIEGEVLPFRRGIS